MLPASSLTWPGARQFLEEVSIGCKMADTGNGHGGNGGGNGGGDGHNQAPGENITSQSFTSVLSSTPISSTVTPDSAVNSTPISQQNIGIPSVNVAAVAGIVIVSVAALVILTLTIFFLLRRRRRARSRSERSDLITPLTNSELLVTAEQLESNSRIREKMSQPAVSIPSPHRDLPSLEHPSILPGDNTHTTAGPTELGDISSVQPMEARLEFLQNTMTWVVQHMHRIEARIDIDEDSIMGRSDAPPPTYASE
ncbi:hypothetical protein GYMLUDRAFT_1024991 [Collybiopsis luxurians FD-317 M1]|uniref:Uncharacterized protein n=1 Tax=Collybiopsis luxurians FD-317 M1 TaxID=944289 RepID=A0A0D0CFN3_9AGAR|nr:hypothetical protein GYMLUDRAFT_1024991 [Collybiopsis luxurians FD-317 M1]